MIEADRLIQPHVIEPLEVIDRAMRPK
ncbi:MAG: hypothetical protein ACI8SJ_002199, partial [Shewanella sp.]